MYARNAFSPTTTAQAPLFRSDAFNSADTDATNIAFSTSTGSSTTEHEARHPAIMIRKLPRTTSEDTLLSMLIFAGDLIDTELVRSPYPEDHGFATAVARFRSQAGAIDAQQKLNGKTNTTKEANMIVELHSSGAGERRGTMDNGLTSGRRSRFGSTFDDMSPPLVTSSSSGSDLPIPESNSHFQTLFSPQSPLANGFGVSGKSTINNDADDETGELLKDPLAYANGQKHGRRPPQLPIARFSNLSLSTTPSPALSGMTSPRALTSPLSPTATYSLNYPRPQYPPVNPADQNPPCNTLYVGNLPIDASEDELKAIFSKQRGYKRLCFRTKQNGPMCFVEFEDVSFATKALNELYGHPLHNSVKGGIRLSFSKNPLGVRSGQTTGLPMNPVSSQTQYMNGMNSAFSAVSGPPPGLIAPPGLNGVASPTSPTGHRSPPLIENGFPSTFGLSSFDQMNPRNLPGGVPSNMPGQYGKPPYDAFMLGR